MARVVCVGMAVLDHVFALKEPPDLRNKQAARTRHDVFGGIAANGARAVARLGGEAVLLGRVGDDVPGQTVQAQLAAEGIDLSGFRALPGVRTSLSAVIIAPDGERMLVNDTDPKNLAGLDGFRPELIERSDAVLVDPHWSEAARLALRTARELRIPSLVDFDSLPYAGGVDEIMALASHVVFGRQGLAKLAGTDGIEAGLTQARTLSPEGWLGVTSSDQGIFWLEDGAIRQMPAFEVETVDTLGAGDIFHGAFALALAEGQPLMQALRFSHAVAGLKCARPGGGAGAPYRDEVEAFLRERA